MDKLPSKAEFTIKEDVAVVKLAANFYTSTAVAKKFKDELTITLDQGVKYYVINMEEVSSIDSEGLGALTYGYKESRQIGGNLVICNLSNRDVIEVIEIVNLHNVIPIFKSEEEAIEKVKTI